jgi:hypothetical protein
MSDTYVSERAALRILIQDGEFTEAQARIVLAHSLKQTMDGGTYYPMTYIYKRAKAHALKTEG